MPNGQQPLFYDDGYDALEKSIAAAGKTKKEVAAEIYPGRQIETAKSLLSRAMTPENTDVHLNLEMILTIMKLTRPDDFIFYLCDTFSFDRPAKKDRRNLERQITGEMRNIQDQLKVLVRQVQALERTKGND